MIKDESIRQPIPEQRNLSRPSLLRRIALTLGFTAAQVWAAYTLTNLGLAGIALCALVLVLAAAFIAVLDAWREMWVLFRAISWHSWPDCGGGSDCSSVK
jgi:hypothetical protein